MNENQKTWTYVFVALFAVLVAWEPWETVRRLEPSRDEAGQPLCPELKERLEKNPLAVASLEIVEFDEEHAAIRPFQVSQINGTWSIPSHSNYPADAREHLAQAATSIMNLNILGVASRNVGDQELYGVIDPKSSTLQPGATGVGTRVILKDAQGKTLADMIIGKEVKDQRGLRYVRLADKGEIYRVAVSPDKLSTKFGDWIEKNLLKINSFDIRQIQLNDYAIDQGVTPDGRVMLRPIDRSRIKLGYDDQKAAWNLLELIEFAKGKPSEVKLADDEELDTAKLNDMRSALDDLQIVDVEAKPKGLGAELRVSEDFVKDQSAVESLASHGFYPVQDAAGNLDIRSAEGEVITRMKDGVEYVLRFGAIAGAGDRPKEDKQDGKEGKDAKSAGVNRFLFIMARFNDEMIPKPQLESLPPEEPAAQEGEKKPADGKAADAKGDEKKSEAKPSDAKSADAKSDEAKKSDAKPDEEKADEKKSDDKPKLDPAKAKIAAARQKIERENKQKQQKYEEELVQGRQHVKELNERFADWYYVIADDVYRKIHLGRTDIIKKKQKPGEGGADANTSGLQELGNFLGPGEKGDKNGKGEKKAEPAK